MAVMQRFVTLPFRLNHRGSNLWWEKKSPYDSFDSKLILARPSMLGTRIAISLLLEQPRAEGTIDSLPAGCCFSKSVEVFTRATDECLRLSPKE